MKQAGWAIALLAALPVAAWAEAPRFVATPGEYPRWAVGTGIETESILRVRIGADGRARDIEIVQQDVSRDFLTQEMRASFDSAAIRVLRHRALDRPADTLSRREVTVHFEDPGALTAADSSAAAAAGEAIEFTRIPEAVRRPQPEWPAAAPYVCRGHVILQLVVDSLGVTRRVHLARRSIACDDGLGKAIEIAALRAARGWRYRPAEAGRQASVVVPVVFRIPKPRSDGSMVVGCVRDSLTGRLLPARITKSDGTPIGETDDTGWFVLASSHSHPAGARSLRAVVPCRDSREREAPPWRKPGDEVTLLVGRNHCSNAGR